MAPEEPRTIRVLWSVMFSVLRVFSIPSLERLTVLLMVTESMVILGRRLPTRVGGVGETSTDPFEDPVNHISLAWPIKTRFASCKVEQDPPAPSIDSPASTSSFTISSPVKLTGVTRPVPETDLRVILVVVDVPGVDAVDSDLFDAVGVG